MKPFLCCYSSDPKDSTEPEPAPEPEPTPYQLHKATSGSRRFPALDRDLANATWQNTAPFIPKVTYGKVIKVYDGDTITVAARPYKSESPCRFSIRLSGIDCPEIRSRDQGERDAAVLVKNRLSDLILEKYVSLYNVKIDKYGRLLCDVYHGQIHVNNWLLNSRLAVTYDGGKKMPPENWLDYISSKTQA